MGYSPCPGIEPGPCTGSRDLSHWTTREALTHFLEWVSSVALFS